MQDFSVIYSIGGVEDALEFIRCLHHVVFRMMTDWNGWKQKLEETGVSECRKIAYEKEIAMLGLYWRHDNNVQYPTYGRCISIHHIV